MSDFDPSPLEPPRLAVFDMDGTLVDSQHMIVAAMAEAFNALGLAPPSPARTRRVVGLSLGAAIASLAPGLGADQLARLEGGYRDAFFALREAGEVAEVPFEGALDALDALAGAGWMLGIATGKSARGLHATLDRFGLGGRFVTLQTADTAPGKPAPDMLLRAMAEAGARAGATVMIGDTSFDMEMARNARVAGIGVDWGYHDAHELMAAGARQVV
ncbi:MAG: HAD-IA family hydrolase, partial [Alphaproteobacteria bacterium]|nr:HAD-IA family hydrolase [Alphaproteobacteria bacterium]